MSEKNQTKPSGRGGARKGAGRKPMKASDSRMSEALEFPAVEDEPLIGRPSEYKAEYAVQATKLCKLGATDQEIADFFGMTARTIYRWKGQYPAFCQALKVGKAEADDRVERSLFARANGYEHEEVDIRVVSNEIVQTQIRKYYPPDTTACIFWLKNRRVKEWRDKVDHEHSGDLAIHKITDEELAAKIEAMSVGTR